MFKYVWFIFQGAQSVDGKEWEKYSRPFHNHVPQTKTDMQTDKQIDK